MAGRGLGERRNDSDALLGVIVDVMLSVLGGNPSSDVLSIGFDQRLAEPLLIGKERSLGC